MVPAPRLTPTAATTPTSSPSTIASSPRANARARSPAPSRRATVAVVPYARKTDSPITSPRTLAAMPRPANAVVDRCPTIAESASTSNGSETKVANAGSASAKISRSARRSSEPTAISAEGLLPQGGEGERDRHQAHADQDVPVAQAHHVRNLRAGHVVGDQPQHAQQSDADEDRRHPAPRDR